MYKLSQNFKFLENNKFNYLSLAYNAIARDMHVFLQNCLGIPQDGVGVEISSGIEPKVELLFFIALAMAVDICVKDVRITT